MEEKSKTSNRSERLEATFFSRPTLEVARALLGTRLVRRSGRHQLEGRIVEVEAYIGEDDQACHASRGRTPRAQGLYREPGVYYVYMIYGMYWCLNVVTEELDFPAAVLIRALEPIAGQAEMKKRRQAARTDVDLCNGPGKLCQAMDVDSRFHGQSIEEGSLWLEQDPVDSSEDMGGVVSCPRVGVDYAGECARYPWRFYLASSECVSRRDRLADSGRSAR